MQTKRLNGQKYGCFDSEVQSYAKCYSLSRVMDMLDSAEEFGSEPMKILVWKTVPESVQAEFNYSSWYYIRPIF